MSVEYVSDEPSGVRIDDREIRKGDVIAGPPDVVAYLAKRPGFRVVAPGVVEAAEPDVTVEGDEQPKRRKAKER